MPERAENQIQKEALTLPLYSSFRVFLWELFLFCLVLGLGITAAFSLQKKEQIVLPEISFWDFILAFAVASLFILLISRLPQLQRGKGTIYRTLFLIVSWWAGAMLISIWLPAFIALVLMGGLVFWRRKFPSVFNHNLCMVLGLAGIGSNLGISLDPWVVVILLVVLSIYDFIAVYKTKHMQKMAAEMAVEGAIFALIVPQKFSEFRQSLGEIKPGGKFLILGGGDVAFPLLLCASLVSAGILNSLIVAVFSLIGLGASFYIFIFQPFAFQKKSEGRQPIPALPPIALFSIIGYLISFLF